MVCISASTCFSSPPTLSSRLSGPWVAQKMGPRSDWSQHKAALASCNLPGKRKSYWSFEFMAMLPGIVNNHHLVFCYIVSSSSTFGDEPRWRLGRKQSTNEGQSGKNGGESCQESPVTNGSQCINRQCAYNVHQADAGIQGRAPIRIRNFADIGL